MTPKERAEVKRICIEMRGTGMTYKAIAVQLGINPNTLQNWINTDDKFKASMRAAVSISLAPAEQGDDGEWGGVKIGASFAAFRKVYFKMDTYPHQQRMVDAIENMGPRDIAMCLVWPEAGKTTTLEDWVCWKLAMNPDHRITYVSESTNHARKVANRVKQRMSDPRNFPAYIGKYGPFYVQGQEKEGKPWAADHFTVNRSGHDERDYSFECRAWKSKAYGTRIDTLIIDDTQSRASLTQTKEIFENIRATYLTRGRQMRTIIIGTRIGVGDVYEEFLSNNLINEKLLVRLQAESPNGEPTAPEMWVAENVPGTDKPKWTPKEFMKEIRRQVGEEVWFSSYQQDPVLNSLATFTAEMVEDAKDSDRTERRSSNDAYTVLSLDPALGGGNALMAMEFTRDKLNILDLDVAHNLSRTEDILLKIEQMAMRYRPVEVVIEEAAFQKGLVNDERLRVMGRERGFRIIPHTTTRNKSDPVIGVASMAGSFLRREIAIPNGSQFAKDRMGPLCHQLRSWRPNVSGKMLTQDTVMALWFGWRRFMDFKRAELNTTNWRRGALPWNPTPISTGLPFN